MKTNLSLLGSTGSIGTQTLDVARAALGLEGFGACSTFEYYASGEPNPGVETETCGGI